MKEKQGPEEKKPRNLRPQAFNPYSYVYRFRLYYACSSGLNKRLHCVTYSCGGSQGSGPSLLEPRRSEDGASTNRSEPASTNANSL